MSKRALKIIAENKKTKATTLDLGNCALTELPEEVLDCVWVEELILSGDWIAFDFEKKEWLTHKSLNKGKANKLTQLPPTLPNLKLLRKLVINDQQIADLAPLAGLANLQELTCHSNKIADLAPLAGLANLQLLDCSTNQILGLAPLAGLANLQLLSCDSNQIASLAPLAGLANLQLLYCDSNQIADLTPLAGLANLQLLSCGSNQIADLAPLAGLANLQRLHCSSNQIADLAPLARLANLQVLYCYSNQIADLAPLAGLANLQLLSCKSNQIASLAPLAGLANLQRLHCNSNQIADLAPLAGLANLQLLDCESNQIASLAPLAGLANLQRLHCDSNQIADLAPLAGLANLQQLYCNSNQIADLAPLAGLANLQRLSCDSNQIADLAPLAGLANLQQLSCDSNQIADLAPILPLIKKGFLHNLLNNPLTNPPVEVVKQGNEAILDYFKEKNLAGTEKSLEAKVVLIGEGKAGKTSLRTRLLRPNEALPKTEDRTKGLDIDIEKYRYPLAGGEVMRLNVFDFGGQDHYKPLHQFFYSKNTLYVLVSMNGDAATNDFEYWLDTAQLFGQNSPVLLVHNLFGNVRSAFNRTAFARFDEIVRDSLEVNLADFGDKRWDEVRSRIEYFASRLPHVHEEIPKSWANVRRTLMARREEQVMPLQEFLRICALPENFNMDESRALRCSEYLHDIGIILHYQDDEDLKQYLIIKNEWATDAAYRVLDDAAIAKRNGHFHRKTDLPRIWCQPEYTTLRPQLLELMKRFRLCFPLKSDGEFIAPQLLPVSPPVEYAWQPDYDLTVYVEYDFLPLGLMSQLIVECHLLIAEDRRLVWREGAMLELPNAEAQAEILLQKRNGKQTIGIRAKGRKKRDLLIIVDAKLEELHRPFGSGLRMEKKIPCICDRCAATEDKWFFNLSELETLQEGGLNTHICIKAKKQVTISDLLRNVFAEKRSNREVERDLGHDSVPDEAPRAFFSYSKTDIDYLKEFKKHLRMMERSNELSFWDDSKIDPGAPWDKSIRDALAQSTVIFLLVSADFLATDYIMDVEMEEAIKRDGAGTATVIPIKMRRCVWTGTPFSHLQGIPRKDTWIGDSPKNDAGWTEVVNEVRALLKNR